MTGRRSIYRAGRAKGEEEQDNARLSQNLGTRDRFRGPEPWKRGRRIGRTMAAIKQSLAWWCFQRGNVTAEDLLAQAARIGYAGVELCPQDVWPKARDAGLRVVTAGGHASLGDGL